MLFCFSPNDGTDIIAKFNVNYSDINNSNPIASDFEPGIDKIDLKILISPILKKLLQNFHQL